MGALLSYLNFGRFFWEGVTYEAERDAPIFTGFNQFVIVLVTNTFLGMSVHKRSEFYFNLMAVYFSMIELFLTVPWDIFWFHGISAIIISLLYQFVLYLRRLQYPLFYETMQILITLYMGLCFVFFDVTKSQKHFMGHAITFGCMATKLLCLSSIHNRRKMPYLLSAVAFFLYPAWCPYATFSNIRRRRVSLSSTIAWQIAANLPTIFFFKCISCQSAELEKVAPFSINFLILLTFQGFIIRCEYYWRAQLAETAVLATRVKIPADKNNVLFNVFKVEGAPVFAQAIKQLNSPVAEFVKDYLRPLRSQTKFPDFAGSLYASILLATVTLFVDSQQRAFFIILFIAGLPIQECALAGINHYFDVCIYGCVSKPCNHPIGTRQRETVCLFSRIFLVLTNHLRMALLLTVLADYSLPLAIIMCVDYAVVALAFSLVVCGSNDRILSFLIADTN